LTSGHRNRDGGRLLERDGELDTIEVALDRAAGGEGGALVVVGAAGIGKSSLHAAAASLASDRGLTVLQARGGMLERELPWAIVRDLLGAPPADLFEGPAAHARGVLGLGASPPTSDPEGAALHGLFWLAAGLASRRPLAILVDDVHWADPSSLRWLGYLAARIGDLAALLLVAGTPPDEKSPAPLRALLASGRRLEPQPLSQDACRARLEAVLPGTVDDELVAACRQTSGGNPFLLGELALALAEQATRDGGPRRGAVRDMRPAAIQRSIRDRVSALGDPAVRLAEAVAALDQEAAVADATAVAGLSESEAERSLSGLIDAGVLDGRLPLTFVHPLVRDVLWDSVPEARRAVLHARAVSVLRERRAPVDRIAVHLLHTEPAGDARAVAELRATAQGAVASGAPQPALAALRRALAEPPPPELHTDIVLELAEVEAMLALPSALERLEHAAASVADRSDRAAVRRRLGEGLFQAGLPAEAEAAFRAALSDLGAGGDPTAIAELEMLIDAMSVITGSADRCARSGPIPASAGREVLAQRSLALISAGVSGAEAADLALRAAGDGAMLAEHGPGVMFSIVGSCLVWCDLLDSAGAEIDAALERAARAGDLPGIALMRFGRSWVSYWRGELAEALSDVEVAARAWDDANVLRGQLAHALYWKAAILVELDELDAASYALRGPVDLPPFYQAAVSAGRARIALARGAAEAARAQLATVRSVAERSPFFASVAAMPWRADEAIAARLDGDRDEALARAQEALTLAERFGVPRQRGIALRALGVVADDPVALERSIEVLGESPSRLERCRSLVELGAILRRRGASARARDPLREGLDLATALGARALERRAREELRATGARPRRERLSGPDALTPAERRVAELAAGELRNRDIAQQLFLTLRTVETHLTSVYRKLGIGSRAELRGALAEGAEVAASRS
jgi:DNA-binding CsgD family transcriptional regulator